MCISALTNSTVYLSRCVIKRSSGKANQMGSIYLILNTGFQRVLNETKLPQHLANESNIPHARKTIKAATGMIKFLGDQAEAGSTCWPS